MLILYTLLVASVGLSSLADASAIKGHARTPDELRSIKLVPVSNHLDKVAKVATPVLAQAQQAPAVAVFESTKRIYNDESIRRLASAQQPLSYPGAAEQVHQAAPAKSAEPAKSAPVEQARSAPVEPAKIAPVEPLKSVPQEPIVAPVKEVAPVQQAPVVPVKPVEQVAPVVVAVPVESVQPAVVQKAPEVIKEVAAPVEAKSAAIVAPKPADDLPPQTDRSAPIHNEAPVAVEQPAPVSVVKVEQPAVVPVASQPEPIVPAAPVAPIVPVAPVAPVAPVVPAAPAAPVVAEVAAVPVVAVVQSPAEPAKESALQARRDDAPAVVAASSAPVEPLIEVPAPDPGLVLSEPIDSTTKLLIDLDEHMQKFLPAEDKQEAAQPAKPEQSSAAGSDHSPGSSVPTGKSAPLKPYSSSVADEPIIPPLPSLEGVEKASAGSASSAASAPAAAAPTSQSSSSSAQSPSATRQGGHQHQNQQQVITQLLENLDMLQNRIQDTINQLVARRRYVMSALLRPMGTYVRRVRTNLERLQNRVNQLQAAAVSVGGGGSRPGGFVDAAAIETIRRRIDDISKRISDIVNRIRFSLTPTSAPLNSNGRK